MKTMFITSVFLLLNVNAIANTKTKVDWTIPEGEITAVFNCSLDPKRAELIRLYDSGQYEHLLFEFKGGGKEFVKQNLGVFQQKGMKITFKLPSLKQFDGKFNYGLFYLKKGLYRSRSDARAERTKSRANDELTGPAYRKPFFIGLKSNVIINNKEAAEQLESELYYLVAHLIKGLESDSAKLSAIEQFIARSIDYDNSGYKSGKCANNQQDIYSIIAGQQRVALCEGYSNVLTAMCYYADIEIIGITGYTRNGFSNLSRLGGYHIWNKVMVDGNFELHDLTWADYGSYADGTWLNVDPEVMSLSHFPDRIEDQLMKNPLSQSAFLGTALVFPYSQGVKLQHSTIPAYLFTAKEIAVTFHKDAMITIFKANKDVLFSPNGMEPKGTQTEHIFFPESSYTKQTEGDSTTYTFEVSSLLSAIRIEVADAYEINFAAVRGTKNDLFTHYLKVADHEHYEKYIRGILAGIHLKDFKQVKQIVGTSDSLFFDHKGNFRLEKHLLESIQTWDGTLSELHELANITQAKSKEGIRSEEVWKSYYVEIPGGIKFTLHHIDGRYRLASIE